MLREPLGTTSKLSSAPGMADIHLLLSMALEHRASPCQVSWSEGEGNEYALAVESSPRGGDAEWRMYLGNGPGSVLLWTYVSCDVLLVYNLIQSSCPQTKNAGTAASSAFSYGDGATGGQSLYRTGAGADDGRGQQSIKRTQEAYRASSALRGDLAHVQMSTLLQSIKMSKMTGCLKIDAGTRNAEVYFTVGVPVHATAAETSGEESIFELLTWKEGAFHFDPNQESGTLTIKQNLDVLLLQGMQLIDYAAHLRNVGLKPESIIYRKHKDLSEKDFESMVMQGAPLPLSLQKRFYRSIDETYTLRHLIDKLRLPRSEWVPLMCNMIRCDLVTLQKGEQVRRQRPALEPKAIDKRAIQNIMMSLRYPETGMFTYPAFLYFLEQEFFRGYRSASPISVIIFQMRTKSGNMDPVREPVPLPALGEAVRRISRVKRHVDLLSHYETYDYALLLPNTKTAGALIFANRVVKALLSEPLGVGIDKDNLSLAFGIACIPEDFLDLSMLLSAAEAAKNEACHSDSPVVLYRDIK